VEGARLMLENQNKRFNHVQWLAANDPAERAFLMLEAVTKGLLKPGDKVALPSIAQPFAWREMWTIYQDLLARDRRAAAAATPPVDVGRQREMDSMWDQYCQMRQVFLDRKSSGAISDAEAEYLGILDGDLDSPHIEHPKFGSIRHTEWMGRASRINNALSRWDRMTSHERAEIPQRLAARNLARRLVKPEEKQQEQA
jgi:hypothetical protein